MNIKISSNISDGNNGRLYVSNHLGYLDVLIYLSQRPFLFVTSLEIKRTPFLGWLTDLGACLYVDRKNKVNISQEVADITEAMRQGFNVLIFPEATSTNGESVLRFRRPLYQSAIDASSAVQPVAINYQSISGKSMDFSTRDFVCWYGDMPFAPHLFQLFGQSSVEVSLQELTPIQAMSYNIDELSQLSWKMVNANYKAIRDKGDLASAPEKFSQPVSL